MAPSNTRMTVVIVVVGAAALVFGGAAAGASPESLEQMETNEPLVESFAPNDDYDGVTTRIVVRDDGAAHWQVELRYRLADNTSEQAFERARKTVSNPPGQFMGRMKAAVDRAENATGRSMAATNGSVRTERSVPNGRFGTVIYEFDWTNFAARSGDQFVVGDAIGGYYVAANETLMIEWADRFERQSVSPSADTSQTNAVAWEGEQQFPTSAPTVELQATGSTAGGLPIVPALAIVGLVTVLGGGWIARSRLGDNGETTAREDIAEGGATGTATATDDAETPPEELLSDEERVLQLLEARGGRMKQQDVIEAMDWSRTKTSDVVSEMHENEQIEKFRLGRENVIALPGEIGI